MPDDHVEGHACYFVPVDDPAGCKTLFGIDRSDYAVHYVGFETPRGWHHRVYADFYWHQDPLFRRSGRVRFYFDGRKAADILWKDASVHEPIPAEVFRVGATDPS